jgi:death on curing protein
LLESAVARPRNHWTYGETDTVILAVALLLGIARNHPFEQGNKRTAYTAADSFLYLNGYELNVPDGEELADLIISVITGDAGEHILVEVFAHHIETRE